VYITGGRGQARGGGGKKRAEGGKNEEEKRTRKGRERATAASFRNCPICLAKAAL